MSEAIRLTESREPSRFAYGTTKDGYNVFDREGASHIHDREKLEPFLPDIIKTIDAQDRDQFSYTFDTHQEIGLTNCVETEPSDEVVYAYRKGRSWYSRFVKNRNPEPTSKVTIVVSRIPEGYRILTAFFGPEAQPELGDKKATLESKSFGQIMLSYMILLLLCRAVKLVKIRTKKFRFKTKLWRYASETGEYCFKSSTQVFSEVVLNNIF